MAKSSEGSTAAPPINLGRGKSNLAFKTDCVWKEADRSEPLFMMEYPGVFVPVLILEGGTKPWFKMPLYETAAIPQDRENALIEGASRLCLLWRKRGSEKRWKKLLENHLFSRKAQFGLKVSDELILDVLERLPLTERPLTIHGDPTLANIVLAPSGDWYWIDPLDRPYIPNDPCVDLGKLFQSCWDYEAVLLGKSNPTFDIQLANRLASLTGVPFQDGLNWCIIHIIRFLPYVDRRVREVYEFELSRL